MPYSETGTIGGTAPAALRVAARHPGRCGPRHRRDQPTPIEVKRWGGAIARGTTPAGHRKVSFSVTVDGDDLGPLARHVTGGTFLNFLKDTTRTHDAYTASDYARLQELKRAYDPDNVFGAGHDIAGIPACELGYAAA